MDYSPPSPPPKPKCDDSNESNVMSPVNSINCSAPVNETCTDDNHSTNGSPSNDNRGILAPLTGTPCNRVEVQKDSLDLNAGNRMACSINDSNNYEFDSTTGRPAHDDRGFYAPHTRSPENRTDICNEGINNASAVRMQVDCTIVHTSISDGSCNNTNTSHPLPSSSAAFDTNSINTSTSIVSSSVIHSSTSL